MTDNSTKRPVAVDRLTFLEEQVDRVAAAFNKAAQASPVQMVEFDRMWFNDLMEEAKAAGVYIGDRFDVILREKHGIYCCRVLVEPFRSKLVLFRIVGLIPTIGAPSTEVKP